MLRPIAALVVFALLPMGCQLVAPYESHGSDGGPARDLSTDAATDAVADAPATDARAPDAPATDAAIVDTLASDTTVDSALVDAATDATVDSAARDTSIDVMVDSASSDSTADALVGDTTVDAPSPDSWPGTDAGCPPTVVITELMINPKGPDPEGEWFELHNTGSTAVSLHKWQLTDAQAAHTINAPTLSIPAGGYVVLGRSQASVTLDYNYSPSMSAACASEICFSNSGDFLELRDAGGTLVDRVQWSSTGWPFASGAAMGLKDACLDNGLASSWCQETSGAGGGSGNRGSPGAAASCQ